MRERLALNRERGQLIDRQIAGTLTGAERERLAELQSLADAHIEAVAPRRTDVLKVLEKHVDQKCAEGEKRA